MCDYDTTQSIGRRYRRQDEVGTPWCVTVDFDSLEDNAVTVRDRDTTEQVRVPIDGLLTEIGDRSESGVLQTRDIGWPSGGRVVSISCRSSALPPGLRADPQKEQNRRQNCRYMSRRPPMAYVFDFDHKHRRPPMEMKDLLGGKGANLAEMTSVLGLPVPHGFTISTDACRAYMEDGWPTGLDAELNRARKRLEEKMGKRSATR